MNIFGPDLARRFGHERLLTTPAWRVEELGDGGFMLLPEPYRDAYVPTWKQASDHLSISTDHYRSVAHLAALLQRYQLLEPSVELLRAALDKPCVLEVLFRRK